MRQQIIRWAKYRSLVLPSGALGEFVFCFCFFSLKNDVLGFVIVLWAFSQPDIYLGFCHVFSDEPVNEAYRFLGFPLWWAKRRSGKCIFLLVKY